MIHLAVRDRFTFNPFFAINLLLITRAAIVGALEHGVNEASRHRRVGPQKWTISMRFGGAG